MEKARNPTWIPSAFQEGFRPEQNSPKKEVVGKK
jgi:hypothetical protein